MIAAIDAGVVDQDVDGGAVEFLSQMGDRSRARHLQRMDGDATLRFGGESDQLLRLARNAYARQDARAVGRILADEFKADAAIGAGDENSDHDAYPLRFFGVPKPPPPG